MSNIPAGFYPCNVIDGFYGDNDKNIPVIRINVEVSDGPFKGQRHTYEEELSNKQLPYIRRTCLAVGWQDQTMRTIAADIAAWIALTGGASTVEIKHIEIKNGKRAGQIWVKANSVGRGPRILKESSADNTADVDAMMRDLRAEEGGAASASTSGTAETGTYGSIPEDDLPFISLSDVADRAPIARVIR